MNHHANAGLFLLDKVSPLFPIARLCGVLPYSDELSLSESWYKYSILIVSSIVAGVNGFRAVYLVFSSNDFLSEGFNTALYIFQSFLNDICLVAHIIQLIFRREKLRTIFERVKKLDTIWSKYTTIFAKRLTGFGLLWVAVSQIAILITDSTTYEKLVRFTYSTTYILFYMIVMEFCCFLELVRNHLVELIQKINPEESKLQNQILSHYALLKLASKINDFFSLQLLIICMRCSINFVCQIFFLLQFLKNSKWGVDMVLVLVFLFGDCFMELLILFCIAASCSETSEKAACFNEQLYQTMAKSNTLFSNDALQLYVLLNKRIQFNACGFFTIGYPLVTSVMAAATTYLIILVQFSTTPGTSNRILEKPNVTSLYSKNYSIII